MIYIFFGYGKHRFAKFLKKGYEHCRAVVDSEEDLLLIEPTNNYLSIRLMKDAADDVLCNIYKHWETTEVIVLKHLYDDINISRFNIISCVGLLKYLLGINKRWIFTPYQLSKYLKSGKIKHLKLLEVINGKSTERSGRGIAAETARHTEAKR